MMFPNATAQLPEVKSPETNLSETSVPEVRPPAVQPPPRYQNVMEVLVVEEIEKQLQALPNETTDSLDTNDAIAYALNRLPSLYATTEEGWKWQCNRARNGLADLIRRAASWGLRAASNPNYEFSTPLATLDKDDRAARAAAEKALQELQLMRPGLS